MTHEETHEVNDPRIPKGYSVTYHELRGYDSPDRWHSAWRGGNHKLGDYGSFQAALEACQDDASKRPGLQLVGNVRSLGNGRVVVQRDEKRVVHVTVQRGVGEADGTARLSSSGAEKLRNLLEKADSDG